MGISPIDLQTMYSQMSNVASRVSHEQQSAQVSSSLQQQMAVNQNSQNIKTVQKAADNDSKTGLIKEDGHQNQNQEGASKKSEQNPESENETPKKIEIREEYLGKHINITR